MDLYPLTYAQKRLWFECKVDPLSVKYNLPLLFKLKGELNAESLRKAWNEVVQHHAALRTYFIEQNNSPYQSINPSYEGDFQIINLSNKILAEKRTITRKTIDKIVNYKFNIECLPLWKVVLIIQSPENFYLLLNFHHIIVDAHSLSIILKDLSTLYNHIYFNDYPIIKRNISTADFLKFEEKILTSKYLHNSQKFWKKYLNNVKFKINLPYKNNFPSSREEGNRITFETPPNLYQDLKNLAHSHKTTLFVLLSASLGTLLYRYSKQKDIIIGYSSGKRNKDFENLCGFLVNNLPLRFDFSDNTSFINIINQVHSHRIQAKHYENYPLSKIVKLLNIGDRNLHQPLFDVTISATNFGDSDLNLKKVTSVRALSISTNIPKSLIEFLYDDRTGNLKWAIEYRTDYFEKIFMENFIEGFKILLKNIVINPSSPIMSFPLIDSKKSHQILIDWNNTKKNYPEDKTIHQLFEEQVKKTPYNIAIMYDDQELTYQQLNEKSNQLAQHLRALGVGPDTLVAIALERSFEMIIGLLGILKAGGAYVPLDPFYPQERLQFMLEDTKAPVLITQVHFKEKFTTYSGKILNLQLHVEKMELFIDSSFCHTENPHVQRWISLSKNSLENLLPNSSPNNLIYVIYTSGSTGKPKGVMLCHKGLSNRLAWMQNKYQLTFADRILQKTPATFDVSVWELFWPLLIGSTEVISQPQIHTDTNLLSVLIEKKNISVCHFVPSMLASFLNAENLSKNHSLRLVITSGEALTYEVVKEFYSNSNIQLHNLYGPTEASIDVTSYQCTQKDNSTPPIGGPIDNTKIYILDSQMNPVPIGVNGEIYIGGVGLARGYLNRPDLTAERFVPNPFVMEDDREGLYRSDEFGETETPALKKGLSALTPEGDSLRLYRTGDLARYLPDGNIEFLGRIDDQVKIRGFRIELGEIESILHSYKNVAQAVTVAREDEPGNKKLVAYVVPDQERLSTFTVDSTHTSSSGERFSVLYGNSTASLTEDLRNHLAESLPDYMIPSLFVFLDKIPLTSNGKIDRKAFPAPDLSLRLVGDTYVAPQTVLEQDLASIWADILKVENIGKFDNFFRIGGDSIMSIQMVSKARQKGIYLTAKDVFNHPTIAALSLSAKIQKDAPILKPSQGFVKGNVPLTSIQSWFFRTTLKERNHYNQAILLQAQCLIDASLLTQAISFLLSHHDVLRLRYHQNTAGNWIQTSLENIDSFSLEEINLSHILSEDQLAQHIAEQSSIIQQKTNIEEGPLLQATLFNCERARPQRLLIVIHHLVVDGVSWRILLEDLEKVYSQLARGENPSLSSKTHSYQQWAKSLKTYASSQSLKKEIPFWQKIIDSIQPLPVDFNHGQFTGNISHTIVLSLTEDETIHLLQRAPKAYRTEINDLLLTALVLATGDWTQDYSLTLSLEGHGREEIVKDIDLSRTVGWFTSIFPVHFNIENPHNLGEAVKTIKERLREIPHKGIGYGILAYLTQELSLSAYSYPNLSFNYLGQWDNILSKEGLFTFSQKSASCSISDNNAPFYPLEINGEIRQGTLRFFWTYSSLHYRQETIENLAHIFIERLKQLIQHCCQDNVFGYTPSDFSLSKSTLNTLDDRVLAILEEY